MKQLSSIAFLFVGLAFGISGLSAQGLPHLKRTGDVTQLIVDGAPYVILGGELHNSSPSSSEYMAPIWDQLARNHVKTVIGAASWELVEPEEGRYDFTAVDDQIKQARARNIRLVLIWFGAYKNAESSYSPSWVRRNEARFPRAVRRPPGALYGPTAKYFQGPVLSVFNDELAAADARAFAALMRHIRKIDTDHTVIMMQVENEVGLLLDSRDRSPAADAAWTGQVPEGLTRYMRENRNRLRPELLRLWERQGRRTAGTWAEVFGTGREADEVFMAWAFGRYVERVARAGAAEHPLPMYANAWLRALPDQAEPGQYPSGGPIARMTDVWKAAAPSLGLLAPDIYIPDFEGTLADAKRADNPIFVPEARFDAGNLFVALGQYDAIGFAPFGVEDGADNDDVFKAYAFLNEMIPQLAQAQVERKIRGFKLMNGVDSEVTLSGYTFGLSTPPGTLGAFGAGTGEAARPQAVSYGLIIETGKDKFLVVGRGISLKISALDVDVEVDAAKEIVFGHGRPKILRTLNGDERGSLFPRDKLAAVELTLLRRSTPSTTGRE